jgi:hypothetical protein
MDIPPDLDRLLEAGERMRRCKPGLRVRYRGVLFDVGAVPAPDSDAHMVWIKPYLSSGHMVVWLSPQLLKAWPSFCETAGYSADCMIREAQRIVQQVAGTLVIPEDAP